MRVAAFSRVAFAELSNHVVDRTLEAGGTVVTYVLVWPKYAVADDVVLLNTLIDVHPKPAQHNGYQSVVTRVSRNG